MTETTDQPTASRLISLAGKDYLTVAEAAEYACISVSRWRARVQREFPPGEFCGKLIYRRVDVQRYVEGNVRWPRATPEPSFMDRSGRNGLGAPTVPRRAKSKAGKPGGSSSPAPL
jgi:hypothetical protein